MRRKKGKMRNKMGKMRGKKGQMIYSEVISEYI